MGCGATKVSPERVNTPDVKLNNNNVSDNTIVQDRSHSISSRRSIIPPTPLSNGEAQSSNTRRKSRHRLSQKHLSIAEMQIPNHEEGKVIDDEEWTAPDKITTGGFTSYTEIQEILSRLKPGELFYDPDFPANQHVITCAGHDDPLNVEWKRPHEIVPAGKTPHLLVDGITRDDIKQGILGDCWFLSSCAAVSQQEHFMKKIIPDDQPLCGKKYQGIVHFRFWRFGEWLDIYIDDLLPVKDNDLIFARGDDSTEFWVPLLEKAYAKLHGSYEAIEGGQTMDALVDLTGGLAERYHLKGGDPNMYRSLINAHKAGAFIACSRKGDWRQATKADENGLVSGHAYTVINVIRINHRMGEEKLLQIRNPWGNETEWKGSWSDHDSNWDWVDEDTKRLMSRSQRDDGEFWMCYKDFCRQFQEVTICTSDDTQRTTGHLEVVKGEWVVGRSAGGSRNEIEKFATNPQYLLTLKQPDDFDPHTDDPEAEGKCSVVIALMQELSPRPPTASANTLAPSLPPDLTLKPGPLQIGFIMYQLEPGGHPGGSQTGRLNPRHFKYNQEFGKSGIYINLREVSGRFEFEPGNYVLIPSTFLPDQPANFMLRVFTQKNFTVNGPL